MKSLVEWSLTGIYFDLWWHGALPLAWPWHFVSPVFWIVAHFLSTQGVIIQ